MEQNGDNHQQRDLLEEEKIQYREKMTLLVKNWATIASVSVIILSYIQYTYKYGICMAFNLPMNAVAIRLNDYIPAVAILCGLALYVVDCIFSVDPLKRNRKIRFSPFRIIWGTAILFLMLYLSFRGDSRNLLMILLISVVPPLIVEVFLGSKARTRFKEIIETKVKKRMKEDTGSRPFYHAILKPALILIVIVILLTPFISKAIAKNRKIYEVCTYDQKQYAVILDHSDEVLVQPVKIESGSMTIFTGSYRYVSKSDAEGFVFREFDQVEIVEGINENAGAS